MFNSLRITIDGIKISADVFKRLREANDVETWENVYLFWESVPTECNGKTYVCEHNGEYAPVGYVFDVDNGYAVTTVEEMFNLEG